MLARIDLTEIKVEIFPTANQRYYSRLYHNIITNLKSTHAAIVNSNVTSPNYYSCPNPSVSSIAKVNFSTS